jgi:dolichyl-phosphate beta-glucosyltransferase
MAKPHLSIITPAYQNEEYIAQTIREIYREIVKKADFLTEVIVAEDGSTDKTRQILYKLREKYQFTLIADPERKGHIKATKQLYQKAKGKLIFFLDSDGECPPKNFWSLFEEFQKGRHDLAVGYREKRKPFYRRLITKIESLITKILFGLDVYDPNCPFRIMTRKAARQVIPKSGSLRFNFNLEQLAWAQRLGFRYSQVGLVHRPRKSVLSPPAKLISQTIIASFELVRFKLRLGQFKPVEAN